MSFVLIGEETLTVTGTQRLHNLNARGIDPLTNKEYVYGYYSGTAAAAAGTVIYELPTTKGTFTELIATTNLNMVKGVGLGDVAVQRYAWFQTKGQNTAVKIITGAATAFSIGSTVLGHSTSSGKATALSNGVAATTKILGISEETVGATSTTMSVTLDCT